MALVGRFPLFDVHCHLQDSRILQKAPDLIRAASEVGVKWIAVNGTSEEDWNLVMKMGEEHPCVIPCFGLHPWYVKDRAKDWFVNLRSILESVPTAAVGEVGLCQSARGKLVDLETQVEVLRQQLHLARELQRPAAIHCVRAFGSLQKLLEEMGDFPAGIILHSYMGSAQQVKQLVNCGAYFSFSGFNTELKRAKAEQVLRAVPPERLLMETDCPDALPRLDPCSLVWVPRDPDAPSESKCCEGEDDGGNNIGSRSEKEGQNGTSPTCKPGKGALNQPANVRALLTHFASLLQMSEEELANRTFENATRLFSYTGSKLLN